MNELHFRFWPVADFDFAGQRATAIAVLRLGAVDEAVDDALAAGVVELDKPVMAA